MFCFHTPEIAAVEIIVAIRCAVFISTRNILAIGRTALNAKRALKQRCTSIMARMNTISRNCKIYRTMSQLDVQSVTRSLYLAREVIQRREMSTSASDVQILIGQAFKSNKALQQAFQLSEFTT